MFKRKNVTILIVLLFVATISLIFLTSGKNITGFVGGDGYFHSIYAENIFKTGKINYTEPYKLFDGNKIDGETPYAPIHYTQFYHLELGIFNTFLGLSTFSWGFTFFTNLVLTIFIYLFFVQFFSKNISSIITLFFYFPLFPRLTSINFMEGFLLLQLFIFLFLFSKFYVSGKKSFLYLSIVFLGFFGITKHIGFFDSFFICFILFFYLLYNKLYRELLLSIILFFSIIIPPYYALWNSIGTIGYGVGTLNIPEWVPFHNYIQILFESKYQNPDDFVWYKLGYQYNKTFLQYIDGLFSYFKDFGRFSALSSINIISILSFTLLTIYGAYKTNKHKREFPIILFILIGCFEFFIMISQGQNLNQYIYIPVLSIIFIFLTGFLYLAKTNLTKIIAFSIIFIFSITNFFSAYGFQSLAQKNNRFSYENEKLQQTLGDIIKEDSSLQGKNYLVSDIQFGYYSKQNNLWNGDLLREDINLGENFNEEDFLEDFNEFIRNYDVGYFILTSQNYRVKGVYDYVSPNIISILDQNNKIKEIKKLNFNNNWIVIYKVN